MKKLNKLIIIILVLCLESTKIYSQDTLKVFSILKRTDSGFVKVDEDICKSKTKGHFYETSTYIMDTLRSISIYNDKGELYDGIYSNSTTLFEYENGMLKFKKFYNRNNMPVEDGFLGYWSVEFKYDNKSRIVKEIYRDKNNNPVKFESNIDFKPPYLEYEYFGNLCIRKWLNNEYIVQYTDTCCCPNISYKLYLPK